MENIDRIQRVALIGSYVPRQCGIATFTSDLASALMQTRADLNCCVVAMSDRENTYPYSADVTYEVVQHDRDSYARCARYLNAGGFDAVCLQHEFGIYGGDAGDYVLDLLVELKPPLIVTLHTVLESPNPDQRRVMDEISAHAAKLVVMSQRGAEMLQRVYGVPEWKIQHIHHGVPTLPVHGGRDLRTSLGVGGKQVLLTFGLLSPDKGIENVIEAMPEIVRYCPNAVYLVVGATHPHILAQHGEAYRERLERRVAELGMLQHVVFENRFVSLDELTSFLAMADLYVTPYLKREQITSGTLAYAVGGGKAVISTPYWYAEELLDEGRGMLVPPQDPGAIAKAAIELLSNDELRHSIQRRASAYGFDMTWKSVADSYLQAFAAAETESLPAMLATSLRTQEPGSSGREGSPQPSVFSWTHLRRMTDGTGLLQHATYSVPNFREGYCLDDNARALLLTAIARGTATPEELPLIDEMETKYLAFVYYAYDTDSGYFRNFMSFDRQWLEAKGSEDSHARALWALGSASRRILEAGRAKLAGRLMQLGLARSLELKSPRAWAYSLLGIDEALRASPDNQHLEVFGEALALKLFSILRQVGTRDWPWFENSLSYSNARLAEALLVSGRWLEDSAMVDAGLESLDWLAKVQSGKDSNFEPVGSNGPFERGHGKPIFDQQPVEACASVSAYLKAWRMTRSDIWRERALQAFGWFLGRNRLGLPLAVSGTGACYDGLQRNGLNLNQGAESTLSYLLAVQEMNSAGLVTLQRNANLVHHS